MMKSEISSYEVKAEPHKTLFTVLAEKDVVLEAGCNGKGRCGRCRVRYESNAPLPVATERRLLSPQELRDGVRLACLHRVEQDCRVEAAYMQPTEVQILTETVGVEGNVGAADSDDGRRRLEDWCIAIDLGTTTIAMQARALSDGRALGTFQRMNPQRSFGSDVISRMQAALDGQASSLQESVEAVLLEGIRRLQEAVRETGADGLSKTARETEADRSSKTGMGLEVLVASEEGAASNGFSDNPAGIYLAGNTVMEHLLAGLSVEGLSHFPFEPVTLAEQRIALSEEKKDVSVVLLPGLSAFVGADLLAGVLVCGMHEKESVSLLIDLGTNGELVIGNRDKLMCTATAAGPAFEGGPGNCAPGTDMIAVIADLMEEGIVDETGLMEEPWFESGIDRQTSNGALHVTQEQIRAVQMAKAAVYAGICVLTKEYGVALSDIDAVYLAGGFGYFLDVRKAARIGLFPGELTEKVRAVGNTALAGAYLYGRNAIAGAGNSRPGGEAAEGERIQGLCRAINLAAHPDFGDLYIEHMTFE